jgi:hypothetical protein
MREYNRGKEDSEARADMRIQTFVAPAIIMYGMTHLPEANRKHLEIAAGELKECKRAGRALKMLEPQLNILRRTSEQFEALVLQLKLSKDLQSVNRTLDSMYAGIATATVANHALRRAIAFTDRVGDDSPVQRALEVMEEAQLEMASTSGSIEDEDLQSMLQRKIEAATPQHVAKNPPHTAVATPSR